MGVPRTGGLRLVEPVRADPHFGTPVISPLVGQNGPVFHMIHTLTTSMSSFL